jgi:hypothetical protein
MWRRLSSRRIEGVIPGWIERTALPFHLDMYRRMVAYIRRLESARCKQRGATQNIKAALSGRTALQDAVGLCVR